MTWGLIPNLLKDGTGGRKPINAKAETVALLPTFRDGYMRRHCVVPVKQLLQVEGDQGRKGKTALRHRHEVRRAICPGGNLGELESFSHR